MASGERIKKWRSFRRMTMPQLSEATGVPASTIYLWEKNRLAPEAEEFAALAQALGVSVPELTGTPAESSPPAAETAGEQAHETHKTHKAYEKHEKPAEHRADRHDGSFDMMLVTQAYHHIRNQADGASPAELTAARGLLQESLKIVRERIKELNDYKRATRK